MTSFDHVMVSTRGSCFQTNPLEQWIGWSPGMIALVIQYFLSVLPMVKIWHFSGKFNQHFITFVTVLKFRKTEIQDRAGISVLVRVLWVMISKFTGTLARFLQMYTLKQFQFSSHWNNMEKWRVQFVWSQCQWQRDVCMTFHCTSVFPLYLKLTNESNLKFWRPLWSQTTDDPNI